MSTIWVYEKPECSQCAMTEKALQRDGLEYETVDLAANADALAWVMDDLGFKQAPSWWWATRMVRTSTRGAVFGPTKSLT